MIATRPAEVETRLTVGHWEGDLINGAHGTGNLATLVERTTRFSLVGRTDSKEAEEVTQDSLSAHLGGDIRRFISDGIMPEGFCELRRF